MTNPLLSEMVLKKLTHIPSVRLRWRRTESPFLNNYSFANRFSQSEIQVQPEWTWISGNWGREQLNLSLIWGRRSVWLWGGQRHPRHYTMENKWRLYVTCQQLPRTGAVTSQGNKRGAPLYGKHHRVRAAKHFTDPRPILWVHFSALPSPVLCSTLEISAGWKTKTPLTFRWKLHKPLKNSRASCPSNPWSSYLINTTKRLKSWWLPRPYKLVYVLKKQTEIWTVLTMVIIVVCVWRYTLAPDSK